MLAGPCQHGRPFLGLDEPSNIRRYNFGSFSSVAALSSSLSSQYSTLENRPESSFAEFADDAVSVADEHARLEVDDLAEITKAAKNRAHPAQTSPGDSGS
jgi:hypothetical protein